MSKFEYAIPKPIQLKNHPDYNELWLQERISEEPSILGLGKELVVIDRERRQDKAGRLDLLLADPVEDLRFEVEIMLGATDESHIIRCIEYWDIERRRYPQYDHCAVLVAEDITSRFLNVLGLLNGQIPMICIQLNALNVGDQIILDFVKVMDIFALRRDDEIETKLEVRDRTYWNSRVSKTIVDMVDELVEIINTQATPKLNINYNKYHIGLEDGTRSRNFVYFRPRKTFMHLMAKINQKEEFIEKLDEAGISTSTKKDYLSVTITPKELKKSKDLISNLLLKAVDNYQG